MIYLTQILEAIAIMIALVTLPLVVELLALTLAYLCPARPRRREQLGRQINLSVVVPAHNEEKLIGRCVENLFSSGGEYLDVLVVAHNCTDATETVARKAGARVVVLKDEAKKGKSQALRCGFAEALAGDSDAVLVVDADSVVCPDLIAMVHRRFVLGAKAIQCRYEVLNAEENQRTRLMSLAFQGFNVIRPFGRDRMGLSAGILGNGFALHREVLERIPYNAHSVVEDLEYHLMLVRAGIRVEFLDDAVVSGQMPSSEGSARTQRARWEGGRNRMKREWTLRLVGAVLTGQLRLVEPLLDLLAMPIATEVALLLAALVLPVNWLREYAVLAFLVVLLHVLTAAASASGFWGAIKIFMAVPGYMFWKLAILPEVWRTSRANSVWIRTGRDPLVGRSRLEISHVRPATVPPRQPKGVSCD